MKVHGNRVYLNMPVLPEQKLHLDAETQKKLKEEMLQKFQKLKIFAIGSDVKFLEVGEEVLVDSKVLKNASIIEIEGEEKLVVSAYDIMHTW